jgi:hypothetical protein
MGNLYVERTNDGCFRKHGKGINSVWYGKNCRKQLDFGEEGIKKIPARGGGPGSYIRSGNLVKDVCVRCRYLSLFDRKG